MLLWHGQGLAPGPVEDMHTGHAEAFELFAALLFLCVIYLAMTSPHIWLQFTVSATTWGLLPT